MTEVFLVLAIIGVIVEALQRGSQNSQLRSDLEGLRREQELLRAELKGAQLQLQASAPAPQAVALVASPGVQAPAAVLPGAPLVGRLAEPVAEPVVAPVTEPVVASAVASSLDGPTAEPEGLREDAPSSLPAVAAETGPEPERPSPPTGPEPVEPSPHPGVTPPPPPTGPSWSHQLRNFDWESLIGVRLFSYLAGVALLVAVIGFLRYSVEHGLLGPPVRMAIGLMLGVGLVVACETRWAQRYRVTAHALTAAGIATLFSTIYASHALWHLLQSPIAAFLLLALVAGVAVGLSIRRDSIYIALLGLLGGFATPVLLSSGQDRPFGLFGYLLLLNGALTWVAYRKRWPLLPALSLGFTALYEVLWAQRFFDADRMPLAMGIVLLFPLFAFASLLLSRLGRSASEIADEPPLFARTALFAAVVPVLFSVYFSLDPACGAHAGLLFGFLFLVALGLALVAAFIGPALVHWLGAGTVLLVTASYFGRAYTSAMWPGILLVPALFAAFFIGIPRGVKQLGHPFGAEARLAVYVAPLMLGVFPILAACEPATAGSVLFFGVLFVLAAGLAVHAVRTEQGPIHFIASTLVLATEAIWSAQNLTAARLLPALLLYGGFALFYLAVPVLAERRGKPLRWQGSGAFLLLGSLGLLFFFCTGSVAQFSLPVLCLLMLLLNVGLLYEAGRGRHPVLALVGMALSFAVLAVWWTFAPLAELLLPAMVAVGGLTLLVLGGNGWLRRRTGPPTTFSVLAHGDFLGLTGHLFLLAVVTQPQLAASLGPWLGTLAVLDLALGIAAIASRRGTLQLASIVASVVVLTAWIGSSTSSFTPPGWVPLASALALGAFGFGWTLIAERRSLEPAHFRWAAVAGLFGAHGLVFMAQCMFETGMPFVPMLAVQAILLVGMLALAWRSRQHAVSAVAALTFGLAVLFWQQMHPGEWQRLLAFAIPPYLLLLLNPLALQARGKKDRLPFVAALVASAFFFAFGRAALIDAGGAHAMGLLPVVQALLLLPHVWLLVRMEAPSERDLGRLALVAGSVLAFLTVAIPLQLDKEWITLGWALEGMALAWLYRRIPHRGLLYWLFALMVVVFVRLSLNPAVLDYHPRAATLILNWYLYTWSVAAACFFGAATLLRATDDRLFAGAPRLSQVFPAAGALLLFLLLNIEIADFYSTGEHITFAFSAGVAQNLTYTIGWALFAIGLLVAGVLLLSRPTRIASIGLLSVTVFKAFLYDLSELHDLYRVASFVGLAFCLVLVAVVLQRFVLKPLKREEST